MTEKKIEITAEEQQVLQILRSVGYGKIVITVKNNKPVFVETQKTIQISER